MRIVIKYNNTRFPRTVPIQGGKKLNFVKDRLILELEEYDALALLNNNNRIKPDVWEFTVINVIADNKDNGKMPPVISVQESSDNKNIKEEDSVREISKTRINRKGKY